MTKANPALEDTAPSYEDMEYRDLQSLAKERGLSAGGSADAIIARLEDDDAKSDSSDDADDAPKAEEATDEPEVEAEESAEEEADDEEAPKAEGQKDEDIFLTTAMKQKKHLDNQPKVSVFIPFESGENPEVAKKIKFPVTINGYKYEIPRGTMVEVPLDVQKIVQERLESEGRAGREHLADATADRAQALNA